MGGKGSGRPLSPPATLARALADARESGRLGNEHDPVVAVAQRLARQLVDPETQPQSLAGLSREYVSVLRVLNLVPNVSGPSDLDALLEALGVNE